MLGWLFKRGSVNATTTGVTISEMDGRLAAHQKSISDLEAEKERLQQEYETLERQYDELQSIHLAVITHRPSSDDLLREILTFLEGIPQTITKAKGGALTLSRSKDIATQIKAVLRPSGGQEEVHDA